SSVEIAEPAPEVRPDRHAAEIPHEDGHAALVGADDDRLEVLDGARVAAAADHVLGSRELDEPPSDVLVAVADRGDDLLDRDAVPREPRGIELDLVLLLEAAEAGDF